MNCSLSFPVSSSIGAFVLLIAAGCNNQKMPVQAASATHQVSYAEAYPEKVRASTEGLTVSESATRKTIAEFSGYPDQLEKTDFALVKQAIELADKAGKSKSYADVAEEGTQVREFHDQEKKEIHRAVAGASQYSAKEKGASQEAADAGASAAVFGLDRAVTKQLEERSKQSSDAQRFLEDHEEALGTKNLETLEKQVEAVSRASYVIYVESPKEKERLEALALEAEAVRNTLDKNIEEQGNVEGQSSSSAKQKKLAAARTASLKEARGKMDEVEVQAKDALKELEQRLKDNQAAYEEALKALLKALDEKAKSEPVAPAS